MGQLLKVVYFAVYLVAFSLTKFVFFGGGFVLFFFAPFFFLFFYVLFHRPTDYCSELHSSLIQ